MVPESDRPALSESRIQVFISHSSQDAPLAQQVVTLLQAGIEIPNQAIRCTSVPENGLEPGDTVAAELRRSLEDCSVVIALLTHTSVASSYVLMELGAAWALEKTACLLLAPGLGLEDLPGPFKSIHAVHLSDSEAMPRLVRRIASATGLPLRAEASDLSKAREALAERVSTLPDWHRRCLRAAVPFGLVAAIASAVFGYTVYLSRSEAPYSVHLLTGNDGGRFYSLGTWLRDKIKSEGNAEPTLERTQGSVDNCERIEVSEANGVALAWSSRQCGESKDHPERKARVVATLYPEVLQFLVHRDADSPGALPDLRGKTVYVGNERSGTRSSVKLVLSKAGYQETEIDELISKNNEISELEFEPAAMRLRKGEIGAAFLGTGLAARAVKMALEGGNVRLVSLPPDLIQKLTQDEENGHFSYASLAKDDKLKDAYVANPYGLASSGYLALNGEPTNAAFKYDSIAANVVLLATESVDKQFIELLLHTLYDGANREALVQRGVSRTYLEQSAVLNQRMAEKGILLNTGVNDFHCWWSPKVRVRRVLYFCGGLVAVFISVTALVALLQLFAMRLRSSRGGRQLGPASGGSRERLRD